jgi:hypothetical protein
MATKKDSRLASAGVAGYNKPKRTPSHPYADLLPLWIYDQAI